LVASPLRFARIFRYNRTIVFFPRPYMQPEDAPLRRNAGLPLGRLVLLAAAAALAVVSAAPACAQARAPAAAPAAAAGAAPGFWDPRRRPERPDLGRLTLIRFMTEVDYPPFDYAGQDGNPTGFNVDLARAICEELHVTCTVQMRRFDTLFDALSENRGDAAIASISVTPEARARADFSDPYYRPVARFAARRDAKIGDVRPEAIEGKTVAVVAGTAHEQYLRALFTEAEVKSFRTAGRCSAARSTCCSATASRCRSGSTAPTRPAAARSSAVLTWRAASSARASASRSSAATTRCGSPSTGRSSGCGRRAASRTYG
jgi:ABC-type amino acid transport substrate-binding protein